MLRQVGNRCSASKDLCLISCSYDLDLDQRLSEETTVLVESYTVRFFFSFDQGSGRVSSRSCSFQTDE